MLWREAYRPRLIEDALLPGAPSTGIVLGGFDLRAQAELGIWWRLLETASLLTAARLVLILPEEDEIVTKVLPRSWAANLSVVRNGGEAWRALIQPDRPERSFAAITRGGMAPLVVVGPPTEDVWERFEALARGSEQPSKGKL